MSKTLPAHITQSSTAAQRFDNVQTTDLVWEPLSECYYLEVDDKTTFYLDGETSHSLRQHSDKSYYTFLGFQDDLFLVTEPNFKHE